MMKTILAAAIAIAAAYVAWLAGTGRQLPFGLAAGAGLWLVVGLGMTACALGPLGSIAAGAGSWTSPWTIAGIVVGIVLLGVTWASASGATLGIVGEARQWLLVLAGLIGVKVVVAAVQAVTMLATASGRG